MFYRWRFVSWFVSWVSSACDWPARPMRADRSTTKYRSRPCWGCLYCTPKTTNRELHRSARGNVYHCRCLEYWTSSRWLYDAIDEARPSERCRRLRWTRPPSARTYQPHHWWRTWSIQPRTTHQKYVGSTHGHTLLPIQLIFCAVILISRILDFPTLTVFLLFDLYIQLYSPIMVENKEKQ